MSRMLQVLVALVNTLAITTGVAFSQCHYGKLTPIVSEPDQLFGNFISWNRDRLVVGANLKDGGGGFDAGIAYVYRRVGGAWLAEATLEPSDPTANAHFGFGVCADDDTIAVGADWKIGPAGHAQGAAYVFRRQGTQWLQEAELTAAHPDEWDFFGCGLLLTGDTLFVGAVGDDDAAADAGAVYVFRRDGGTWVEQGKIYAPDAAPGDGFGQRIQLAGDRLVVSAPPADGPGGVDQGAAYVFRLAGSNWDAEARLQASDGAADDYLGAYVAAEPGLVVTSAHGDDNAGHQLQGSAYVFRFDGGHWLQEQKLTASDGASEDLFGTALAVRGDAIVVGAIWQDDHNWADQGAAYLFRHIGTRWVETEKISNPEPSYNGEFGSCAAFGGDGELAIGARDTGVGSSGTLFLYSLDGPDCDDNGVPDLCDIATGAGKDEDQNGILDVCEGCELVVSGWLADKAARFDGTTGNENGTLVDLASPQGMTYGSDGNLYVASEGQNQVLRCDGRTGIPLGVLVDDGTGLAGPTGLAFGSDGDLYVASFGSDEVLRFDGATGAFRDVFVPAGSGKLDGPDIGLAFGPDGNLYVASFFNHRVNRYDARTGDFLGAFVAPGSGGLRNPRAIQFRSDGTLLVGSWGTGQILHYDRDGHFITAFASVDHPTGLAVNPRDRNLYVSSDVSDTVARFDGHSGQYLDTFVDATPEGATHVAFLPDLELRASRPSPGRAGTINTLTVVGATPRSELLLLIGTVPASLEVQACRGGYLGMADPLPLRLRADTSGRVTVSGFVPDNAAGLTVLLQAFEPSSCRLTSLIRQTLE